MTIALINGPNLDMLGVRDPKIYGSATLNELYARMDNAALELGAELIKFQSNSEGGLIDFIHSLRGRCDGIIINAGAYSHYSFALRDALECMELPVIEVHISNVYRREEFRRKDVIAPVCAGVIAGLGFAGYSLALSRLASGEPFNV